MVADIGNPAYVQMMQAVHEVVADAGYQVLVASTGDSGKSIASGVRSLSSGFVDGLVLAPLWVDDDLVKTLGECPVPVVVASRIEGSADLDSVSVDSAAGVALAVDHLVNRGRSRLAFINGPLESVAGNRRRQGFEQSLAKHGLTATGIQIADDFTMKGGALAANRLIERLDGQLDAVVAANDLLAIGCIQALSAQGLRVPDDVAVTGMDNTELGEVISPSLTSVDLRAWERGRQAALLLLDRINGEGGAVRRMLVEPQLFVRDSTGGSE